MTPDHPVKAGWNPWPWSIIAFFAMAVPAVIGYAVFASRQNMDLVRNDYYEEELRYQRQIDATQRANAAERGATITYDAATQQVRVAVPVPAGQPPIQATLQLYRPSDASLDRSVPLVIDGAGARSVDAPGLKPGLWRTRLSWKVGAEEYYHADQLVVAARP